MPVKRDKEWAHDWIKGMFEWPGDDKPDNASDWIDTHLADGFVDKTPQRVLTKEDSYKLIPMLRKTKREFVMHSVREEGDSILMVYTGTWNSAEQGKKVSADVVRGITFNKEGLATKMVECTRKEGDSDEDFRRLQEEQWQQLHAKDWGSHI